ncbi:transporter substrate-binding domain-containing protein [Vibrio algivorus]|nr:transporter substrate-binding domain-containing protein [Vibrio algivorus]
MFKLVSILVLFFTVVSHSIAAEDENLHQNIRVGVVGEQPSIESLDDIVVNRDLDLSHKYISSIFSQLGRHSSLYYFSSYDELFHALSTHQIDLAYGAYGSKYLTANLVESKTVYQKLTTVWSKEQDFYHISEGRWGCVDGSIFCEKLEKEEGRNVIKAPNFLTLWQMLKNGSLDAIASSYTNVAFNYNKLSEVFGFIKVLPKKDIEDVRFIASKDHIRLINSLNNAIEISKGMYGNKDSYQSISELLLSIGNDKYEIKYSVPFDSYPFFYVHDTGSVDGYLVDMFSYMEKHTGIKLTYVPLKSDRSAVDLIDTGEVDVVPVVKSFIKDNRQNHAYSNPFFSFKFVALYKEANDFGKPAHEEETGVLFSDSKTYRQAKTMLFGDKSKTYVSIDAMLEDLNKSVIKKAYIRDGLVGYSLTQQERNQYFVDRDDTVELIISMVLGKDNKDIKKLFNIMSSNIDHEKVENFKTKYTPFSLTYGYDKQVTNIIFVLGSILVMLLIYVIRLRYKTLKIKVQYQEETAQKTKTDIDFLQNVIDAIPGAVRIYNESLQPVMSNIGEDDSLKDLIHKIESSDEIAFVLQSGQTKWGEITLDNRVWRCIYTQST